MWTPPADELIDVPHTQAAPSGAWTPPQEELVGGSSAMPEDPGLLKSAAAGLMSGVPLAESAVAGIEALSPDKTYEQAHQELEGLRDRAWDAHPVAYGAGKTAGMVGTGVATGGAGIPGAIAIGAGSGLDAAGSVQDMPKAIAEGAAMGGILGTVGEKVISPLISKVLPATAKTMLGALDPGKEAVEARLANREAIEGAMSNPDNAAMLKQGLDSLSQKNQALSETAKGLLNPENKMFSVPSTSAPETSNVMGAMGKAPENEADTLKPIFDQVKQRFMQGEDASNLSNVSAVRALDGEYERLMNLAKQNGGALSETDVWQKIKALQDMVNDDTYGNPDASAVQRAMSQLSGALNGALKTTNTAYDGAMKPVQGLTEDITGIAKAFGAKPERVFDPATGASKYVYNTTDTTNSKINGILNENKSGLQEFAQRFKDLTGHDIIGNRQNYEHQQAFEKGGSGGAFSPLNLLLGTLGFGAGKATRIPMGGAAGAAAGHFAGRAMDGGHIAKNLIDMYLDAGQSLTDSGAKAALQKYGPMLVQAAKAGGTQLAATHFVLSTSHPEYQQLTQHMQDNQPQ